MKRKGPDSLEGLFIALICCLIYTLMQGSAGLSGMLFVACIDRYNTERDKASLPFTLCSVLQAVSGPFTGYLAKKFSVRGVVIAGSILASLGIGTCFFAEDILAVTVCWGIVFGIGFGLSTLLLPAVINDYFVKQRSKALGLCYLGSPIGFFIFPPIFEVLLDKFGLSGTFLLLSGINLHSIPLSIFIKQPNFSTKDDENSPLNSRKRTDSYLSTECGKTNQILQTRFENSESGSRTFLRRNSIEFLWNKSDSTDGLTKQYVLSLDKKCADESDSNRDISRSFKDYRKDHYKNRDSLQISGKNSKQIEQSISKIYNNLSCREPKTVEISTDVEDGKNTYCKNLDLPKDESYELCSTICFGTESNIFFIDKPTVKSQTDFTGRKREINVHLKSEVACHFSGDVPSTPTLLKYNKVNGFSNISSDTSHRQESTESRDTNNITYSQSNPVLSMYLNPIFILMCIANAIASLHFTTLTTVIIDFSRDLNISIEYDKYIMMCIAIMGGVGMLGFGWVTDGEYLSRTKFGSLCLLVSSVSTALFPLTVGFETLMVVLAIWCIAHANFIPLIPAIIAEYFKGDIQAIAVSACFVLCGPFYLIIPPLIGYFRDERGSYDNIFFLLSCLAFVNCVTVFTIPYIARWRHKR